MKVHLPSIYSIYTLPSPQLELDDLKESRVSKKLSDLTTKRVIVIVLLLLLLIPLLSADYYFEEPDALTYALDLLGKYSVQEGNYPSNIEAMHKEVSKYLADNNNLIQLDNPF